MKDETHEAIDRQVARVVSVGSIPLAFVVSLPEFIGQRSHSDVWWNALGIVLLLVIVSIGELGRFIPYHALRIVWMSIPILGGILAITSSAAADTSTLTSAPWAWTLEPSYVAILCLLLRPVAAVLVSIFLATLPAVSSLIFLGSVPHTIASVLPSHINNFAFVVIFFVIRAHLIRLRSAKLAAFAMEKAELEAQEQVVQREQMSAMMHDEVLSFLNTALTFTGTPPEELTEQSQRALLYLENPIPAMRPGQVDTATAIRMLQEGIHSIAPNTQVECVSEPGFLPTLAVDTIARAASEALRNSVKHAGPDVTISARIFASTHMLTTTITDNGCGYDLSRVPAERIGVRESIQHRMSSLSGGNAEIWSAPGKGTEVCVSWQR